MPMRFADLDGTLIDVYQAVTQMTDESGQSYPFTVNTLLDRALGPEGYYGAFTVNAHTDPASSAVSDAVVSSALARVSRSSRRDRCWNGLTGATAPPFRQFPGMAISSDLLLHQVPVQMAWRSAATRVIGPHNHRSHA